jgi:hypothetical protein
VVFEVRLVTAEDELALSKLDYPVTVNIPVDTISLEAGQVLQVSKCSTWTGMKEYCPCTKSLLSILTGINDTRLCRPVGLGIRCSTPLSKILCLRLAVSCVV